MLNKMLRATLTKLKKVCFETLTPRIFRGDYYIPGKFQKFCTTTVNRAHKSTGSGKGSKDEDENCKQLIDEIFNNKAEDGKIPEDPSIDLSNIQELKREQISQIVSPHIIKPPETECQICEKLIAQAFDKGDDGKELNDAVVSATTAKQTEEQLAQKLESIDETPVVEAEKPSIEGFNVKPKVLGAEEKANLETVKCEKSEENDGAPVTIIDEKTSNDLEELCQKIERGNRFYHAGKNLYKMPEFNYFEKGNPTDPMYTGVTYVNHPYDDIAKRCVNLPTSKIDQYILKELQRLGVPHSSGYASNSNNIGNVEDLSNEYNLQKGNVGDPPPDDKALNPPHENEQVKVESTMIHELDKKPMPLCMMEQNVVDDTIMTLATVGPKPEFNPNRMLLDPFDKRSLCFDCVDPEYATVSYDKVHVLVQRLENKNIEQNDEKELTVNFQTTETAYTEQSKNQTQSSEQTQLHVKPEYKGFEVKPLHESPRLPEKPINYCNENFPIHPLNREQHYSMKPFEEGQKLHNQMNYQENMVPKHPNNQQYQNGNQQHQYEQQHEYHVITPINHPNQQQYFWNRDQNQTNYYENRFQGGEQQQQHYQTTPEESSRIVNVPPHEEQTNTQTPAVHVFTNAATGKTETLETILPHRENITAEEVSEDAKQQTPKQLGNISEGNTAPETAENAAISHQYNFNEQNPQQIQFFQPNEQPIEQGHMGRSIEPIHVSVNEDLNPFDLRRQTVEPSKEIGTGIAHKEQPTEEAKIIGSVKVHSEQLDKEERSEKTQTIQSDQHDKNEQPTEQAQIIGSVKVHSEQLDKNEQSTEQTQTIHSKQRDKKEQPSEQAQNILRSVKVDAEQLDKNKQSTEQTQTIHSKQLDKKKQPAEQAQNILQSVKVDAEQLDKNELSTEQTQTIYSKQLDKKEQPAEQAKILEPVKAHQERFYQQERPIEHIKNLNFNTQDDKYDLQTQPIEQPKVLNSIKADQEQLKENKERPIDNATSARQERIELKKKAIEQLKILEIPKSQQERTIADVKLLSSKPQERLDDLKEQTKQANVFASVKTQVVPEEKVEQIQQEPKSEDPNDEFKKKLSSTILPLPKLNTDEQVPLSVLLKRLRERNKIESCHEFINPLGRKCGKSAPPCPPPAPTCPPPKPCPPPPCPPPPPPCPKPCKPACPNPCGPPKPSCPPKKPTCSKYIQVDADFDFPAILRETDVFLKKRMYETVSGILTKEVIMQLEKMGVSLLITYPNEELDIDHLDNASVTVATTSHNLEASQVNSTGVDLAKDYEPWVPIPSWPIPRKVKKRPLVCPKDGCKIIPPPRLNPPCTQNPCIGFPKRKNSFSTPNDSDMPENVSVTYES